MEYFFFVTHVFLLLFLVMNLVHLIYFYKLNLRYDRDCQHMLHYISREWKGVRVPVSDDHKFSCTPSSWVGSCISVNINCSVDTASLKHCLLIQLWHAWSLEKILLHLFATKSVNLKRLIYFSNCFIIPTSAQY